MSGFFYVLKRQLSNFYRPVGEVFMYYADDIVDKLKSACSLAVFGAGIMAEAVVYCLKEKPYQLQIRCCLVSRLEGNPSCVSGVPVMDFSMAEQHLSKETLVLVASVGKGLASMTDSLHRHGYFHLLPLTYEGDLWSLLQGNYYREYCLGRDKLYWILEEELEKQEAYILEGSEDRSKTPSVCVYTAKCHLDKAFKEDMSRFSWETPIQAGAALTDQRICGVCDNTGDNISDENRQYRELTALYWIWKNDQSDYVGLGHYRRHFEMDEKMLGQLAYSDIDVVLTIPILDIPSVGAVYRRDHVGRDWDIMLEAVKTLSPDYLEAVKELEAGCFYYAYSMFIMRRPILEDYCQWLFPLLSYCEKHCGVHEDGYQGRYIGFLAEHLMSVYFLYHEKDYKIVHARKHFVEG